jgi:hypothetical protein
LVIPGLQRAAPGLREREDRREFIQAFTGNHRLVLDYLAEVGRLLERPIRERCVQSPP